jgi:hypothetical protein
MYNAEAIGHPYCLKGHAMKSGAAILALGVFLGGACCDLAFAQNSVGGPTRPTAIGGPAKQTSPVLPGNKAGSTAATPPSTVKCVKGSCKG